MKSKKTFDCVEMKREIHARIHDERRRIGEAEFERRHKEWLEFSDDPLARWWRSLATPKGRTSGSRRATASPRRGKRRPKATA